MTSLTWAAVTSRKYSKEKENGVYKSSKIDRTDNEHWNVAGCLLLDMAIVIRRSHLLSLHSCLKTYLPTHVQVRIRL